MTRSAVVRRAVVRKTPYVIVYAVIGDEIVVVAFAHTSQRPGYWRKRVRDV